MPKKITKFEDMSGGFSANGRYAVFSIGGPKDKVRIAARDAIYGLKGIDWHCEHVTEELKMKGMSLSSILDPEDSGDKVEHAQIDISISIKAFDRLVLMFRYCLQVGVPVGTADGYLMFDDGRGSVYEFTRQSKTGGVENVITSLGHYLAAARKAAEENQEEIVIEKVERPANRNFWTQAELAEDAKVRNQNYQASKQGIFKDVADPIARRKQALKLKMEKIYDEAGILTDSYPKNPSNYSLRTTARGFIWQYKEMKQQYKTNDFLKQWMIRDDDCDKFVALAEKYDRFSSELSALEEMTKPRAESWFKKIIG